MGRRIISTLPGLKACCKASWSDCLPCDRIRKQPSRTKLSLTRYVGRGESTENRLICGKASANLRGRVWWHGCQPFFPEKTPLTPLDPKSVLGSPPPPRLSRTDVRRFINLGLWSSTRIIHSGDLATKSRAITDAPSLDLRQSYRLLGNYMHRTKASGSAPRTIRAYTVFSAPNKSQQMRL